MQNLNGGGFGSKPKALMCYICGREYGTASLQIHLKTCMKKWEIEESKKPKKERRPMPQPPKQLSSLLDRLNAGESVQGNEFETYNNKANDEWNESALIRCEFCNRTFLPDRLPIHRKICTAEKPFKPLPPPAGGSGSNAGAGPSRGMGGGGMGGGSTGAKGGYGGGQDEYPSSKITQKKAPTTTNNKAPSRQQHEEYNDDDEGNSYVPPSKPTQSRGQPESSKMSKPMPQSRSQPQNYGGDMGDEYEEVQLVECELCGRKFAADRLDRHQKACTKAQKAEAKHAKKVAMAEKKQMEVEKFIAKESKYKKNNWRDQHKEFVENLKYNRKLKAVEEQGGDIRQLGPPPKMSAIEANMVECPYCSRKFNPQSAEKHISICKNVVNKPKPVPGKTTTASRPSAQPSYGTGSGFGTGSPAKPTGTKVPSQGSLSKYPSSYGGGYEDEYQQASYNPSNYAAGVNQAKQIYGSPAKKPTIVGGNQYSPQTNSSRGTGTGGGTGSQYSGGSTAQSMNSSNRSGFGAKQPSSSLANAGKMAMQDYSQYGQQSMKNTKTGYRY